MRGLDEGRAAVSAISSAATRESLDEAGIARAAIEIGWRRISPMGSWRRCSGSPCSACPASAAYKAINTLDSMIGHRNDRYEAFGKVAARLDDVVNWIPARLAGLLFVLAAAVLPGADARAAWRTMWRDAGQHKSPNAGWQEAALAGALGFALAGPRRYGDEVVDDPWMGDGRSDLTADDLRAALRLYLVAGLLILLGLAAAWAATA